MFQRVAIVAAMEREISFLRRAMAPPDRSRGKLAVGSMKGKVVHVLRTGVGPLKTSQRLTELLTPASPECVLSIGCAGALRSDINVGDIIISDKLADDTLNGRAYYPSVALLETAKECCRSLKLPFHSGCTVSTSSVAATTEQKKSLAEKYGAVAVDMESARVAAWAQDNGVSMVSIRTVSDSAVDRLPPELALIIDRNGRLQVGKILALFLEQPRLMPELLRLTWKFDHSLRTLQKGVMALLASI